TDPPRALPTDHSLAPLTPPAPPPTSPVGPAPGLPLPACAYSPLGTRPCATARVFRPAAAHDPEDFVLDVNSALYTSADPSGSWNEVVGTRAGERLPGTVPRTDRFRAGSPVRSSARSAEPC